MTNMTSELFNMLVPITSFNKGKANKIFGEVEKTGTKIVMKRNTPICVLVSPDEFAKLEEIKENYYLLLEAEERINNNQDSTLVNHTDLLAKNNISKEDLEDIDVEIE